MTGLANDDDIASIPKIELHVHFGGNFSEAIAAELAERHGVDPAIAVPLEDGRYPRGYRDFPEFLRALIALDDLVRTPEDVETVAAAFARGQASQGVIYSEVIVTALSHIRQGIEPDDLWAALRSGFATAPETRIGIVADAIRNDGPADLEVTLRLIEAADAPIVGVGLTGIEGSWPVGDFAMIRREADRLGLGVEVHAGEMGPPASIAASLDVLGADRIGHGVAATYDPALLERLVRERVPLDVCPTSNVQIGLFPSLEAHPVRRFWEAGVNMTISSDDPHLMGTTLTDELRHVARLAGLTRDGLAELQRRAARAAFLPAAERLALEARIDAWAAPAQI
ncbi:MAG TPA: adenosine deaminase [Candidatus Limnocylindrales bacterium]|nr:adenosine deaminase [Candidatus Limnocylindrales bacterium]